MRWISWEPRLVQERRKPAWCENNKWSNKQNKMQQTNQKTRRSEESTWEHQVNKLSKSIWPEDDDVIIPVKTHVQPRPHITRHPHHTHTQVHAKSDHHDICKQMLKKRNIRVVKCAKLFKRVQVRRAQKLRTWYESAARHALTTTSQ